MARGERLNTLNELNELKYLRKNYSKVMINNYRLVEGANTRSKINFNHNLSSGKSDIKCRGAYR